MADGLVVPLLAEVCGRERCAQAGYITQSAQALISVQGGTLRATNATPTSTNFTTSDPATINSVNIDPASADLTTVDPASTNSTTANSTASDPITTAPTGARFQISFPKVVV